MKTKPQAKVPTSITSLMIAGTLMAGLVAIPQDRILPTLRQYLRIMAQGDVCLYDEREGLTWYQRGHEYLHSKDTDAVFACFRNALEFDDSQSAYHQDFGNFLILYRRDACRILGLKEDEVIALSLKSLRLAVDLKPGDFEVAKDYAITFGLLPPKWSGEAREAWEAAFKCAKTESDRQWVLLNLARLDIIQQLLADAEQRLREVVLDDHQSMREILFRRLLRERNQSRTPPHVPKGALMTKL